MRISGKFVPLLGAAGLTVATALLTVTPASALDNGLALTPPMGFNNWNSTRCKADFNESMVKSIADIFVSSGLQAAGYRYVNLDDCWAETKRDSGGHQERNKELPHPEPPLRARRAAKAKTPPRPGCLFSSVKHEHIRHPQRTLAFEKSAETAGSGSPQESGALVGCASRH